ncbi:MAG: type II secretion system protein N [Pseudomonadota bacterium]
MRWAVYFTVAFVVFVVATAATLPLAVVTSRLDLPVEMTRVSGTVWKGAIDGLSVNGQTLGDAKFRVRPWSLLSGRPSAHIDFQGRGLQGAGDISFNGDLITLTDASGTADLVRFGFVDAFGQPLRGSVKTEVEALAFSLRQGCRRADLSVATDAVSRSLGAYAAEGFPLEGQGRCEGDALLLPLAGQGPDAAIEAELRLNKDGSYVTKLAVTPEARELGIFLAGMGFEERGGAFVTQRGGSLEADL